MFGVNTVKELRNRNVESLATKMEQANVERKLVRQLPTLKTVTDWVEQAKDLPPKVTY